MKTLLVRNPVAGQRDVEDDLRRVLSYLAERGWDVSVRLTERPGHATELAREAATQGYDMVVAVGGDGTIGEVAAGLVGTSTTLGVLPVGTGNQWAHMLDQPLILSGEAMFIWRVLTFLLYVLTGICFPP